MAHEVIVHVLVHELDALLGQPRAVRRADRQPQLPAQTTLPSRLDLKSTQDRTLCGQGCRTKDPSHAGIGAHQHAGILHHEVRYKESGCIWGRHTTCNSRLHSDSVLA